MTRDEHGEESDEDAEVVDTDWELLEGAGSDDVCCTSDSLLLI